MPSETRYVHAYGCAAGRGGSCVCQPTVVTKVTPAAEGPSAPPETVTIPRSTWALLLADASLGAALRAALGSVPVSYELHIKRHLDTERRDQWAVVVSDPAFPFASTTETQGTRALASALSERKETK